MRLIVALLIFLPFQSQADPVVDKVLEDVVLPGVEDFAAATGALASAAQRDCGPQNPNLIRAWNTAMDSWFGIQDLRFGPMEEGGRRQAIAYWPDINGHRPRALKRILTAPGSILQTPDRYSAESVSARGLYAIEAMLFDQRFNRYSTADPGCVLVQAASADLARIAESIRQEWVDDFAQVMRSAGQPDNARFLDTIEVRQAMFTALLTGLQFDINERLGQTIGTFDKPRPNRAEGRLSGRSQRNLELSLAGHEKLALALIPEGTDSLPMREDFERIRFMAAALDDPVFDGVTNPVRRFRIESMLTAIYLLRQTVNAELSALLGVTMGLNALDGD